MLGRLAMSEDTQGPGSFPGLPFMGEDLVTKGSS